MMETVKQLLERAGLSDRLETLPPFPQEVRDLNPENPALKDHYLYLYPKTLEELRVYVGVPIEVANEHPENFIYPKQVAKAREKALRMGESDEEPDEETLVNLAKELLLLPLPDEKIFEKNAFYRKAKDYMLRRAEVLPVLTGNILEIADGETKEISSTSKLVYEKIIIHGSGCMKLCCDLKIDAIELEHLDK